MNAPAFPFHEVLAAVGFAVQPGPEPLPAHPSVSAQARSQENEGWRTRGWSFLQARRSSVRRDRAMPAMSRETTQTVPPGPVCCRLGAKGLSSGALVTPVFIVCAPVPSSSHLSSLSLTGQNGLVKAVARALPHGSDDGPHERGTRLAGNAGHRSSGPRCMAEGLLSPPRDHSPFLSADLAPASRAHAL